jgi:hypothetical protein
VIWFRIKLFEQLICVFIPVVCLCSFICRLILLGLYLVLCLKTYRENFAWNQIVNAVNVMTDGHALPSHCTFI